jgi:outer membrane protein OmpA-like peptidoglycan-associated protein
MFRRTLRSPLARTLLIGLAFAPVLAACTTRVKPAPSPAIVAARAGAGHKPAACGADQLADISPTAATFGFDVADLSEAGRQRLARAAAWLKCNPAAEAVILPSAQSRGKPDHEKELAVRRGEAVKAALRALGVQNDLQIAAPGAPDPLSVQHLVIQAADRGW